MSNNGRIAKNTFYMYVRMALTMAIGFYSSRVVLNTLGVEDYGIYNVVGGVVILFAFLNLALSQATQRFIAFELGKGNYDNLQNTFCMSLNVHIIIALIVAVLAETIGLWFLYNKLVLPETRFSTAFWVYQLSVIAAMISITQVPYNAVVNAHEKFNVYALVSIFDACYRLMIVLTLPFFSGDLLLWYALLVLSANVIQAGIYRIYCLAKFAECKFKLFWDASLFKRIFGYTSWNLIGNVADMLADQGVNILLNLFFGPAVNAARGIAVHVKTSVAGFVTNFQSAANPQIVKRYAAAEFESMVGLVLKTSKVSFFLFLMIMLPLCIEMEFVLKIWLGQVPQYLPIFCVLTLGTVLLQSLGGTVQLAIQASGNIKMYQILVGGAKLCALPVCYCGLREGLSPVYPFAVVMAIYGGVVAINLFVVHRVIGFPLLRYVKEVILVDVKVFVVSLLFPVMSVFLLESFDYRYLISIPLSFFSVCFVAYYVGMNCNEKEWIKSIVLNVVRGRKK